MRRTALATAAVLAALALAAPVRAQEAQAPQASWIHIRVDEVDGAKVNVNLPMSLVEMALEIAGKEAFDGAHGPRFHMGRHHDVDIADLRRMWSELRAAGDAEFVDAVEHDKHVRIYRQGDRVHIDVDDDGDQKVRLEVPFSVVDVLLEGEGEELNLAGAVRELARANNGQIIQVNDGDTTVRIWIDDKNQG